MSSEPKTVFRVASPAPELVSTITLTQTTWDMIVQVKHVDVAEKLADVVNAAEDPQEIIESNSRPGHLLFVSKSVLSPNRGHPLTLVMKPVGLEGFVSTVHFKRRKSDAQVLWTSDEADNA